ncbi:hypothetical protein EV138_7267 [Kribbella voronezhensis]|uniref:Uncharacterized protein n=1 Tax=Kribbella voronezhensis TaxID=2512212 RepID=A0A4R7SVH1_9ACTN|nr:MULTISPECIES: hypothetical protein [Kribbella]TDU82377.1 hypothetical protein EV138_7267 [Kribbella voronezhensis]
MKFERESREARQVSKPPPEAMQRVDGGGAWGPTQFDLPEPGGKNTQAITIVVLIGVVILLVLAGLWTLAYYKFL